MTFKLTDSARLLAIDPSLTASGWALYSIKGCRLIAAGVLKPPGPGIFLADRLSLLQTSVQELLEHYKFGPRDLLVTEGPAPLVLNPQSAMKVERVRSIFEAVARMRSVQVPGRVNPRSIQTELMGMRGKQLDRATVKTWARDTAQRLFGTEIFHAVEAANREFGETGEGLFKSRANTLVRRLPQDIVDASLIGYYAVARLKLAAQLGLEISCAFQPKMGRGGKRVAASADEIAAAGLVKLRPAAPPVSSYPQNGLRRSPAARIGARPAPVRPGAGRLTATHPATAASTRRRRGTADGIIERSSRRSIVWTEAELDRLLKRR